MTIYPFREWLPDQAAYRNAGVLRAVNLLPSPSGYAPMPKHRAVTSALTARPRGAISATDAAGNVYQYAGDATKLYRNVSNTWTDSSAGTYTTAANERWEFARWKDKVLAVNYSDNPQQITLGGTAFSELTADLKARHIATVGNFVVLADTVDSTDGAVAHRVRWCALGNETDWTVDPATLADYRDLRVGVNRRVFGGEYGVVWNSTGIWRMTFAGAPTVFQLDEVQPGLGMGLLASGCASRDGDVVYGLSQRGFVAITRGSGVDLVGANRIDRTVLNDIDQGNLHRCSMVADPRTHRVLLAYPGSGNSGGRPNRILLYDRALDRFSLIEFDGELLWQAGGLGYTLEGLDSVSGSLDSLGISLDSPAWVGGTADVAAFDGSYMSGFFDDETAMTGLIEMGEMEFHEGHKTAWDAFTVVAPGATVTARVGVRNTGAKDPTWGSMLSPRPSGRFKPKRGARKADYHRAELTLSGDWEHAVGLQVESGDAIRAERRRG